MAWAWLNGIVKKVAAEVHKTKISEFESRLLEIERKQEVILKCLQDNQNTLDKLDNRLYQANMDSAAAVGAINAMIQTGRPNQNLISQDNRNDNSTDKK